MDNKQAEADDLRLAQRELVKLRRRWRKAEQVYRGEEECWVGRISELVERLYGDVLSLPEASDGGR